MRKVLAALAIAIVVVAAACAAGPRRAAHGPVAMQGPRLLRAVTLRLPTGLATETLTIAASAELAYDVRVMAPAGSAVALAMRMPAISTPVHIAPRSGWTVGTEDRAACRALPGRTACLWHFAAGGNPGGAWTAVVRKSTEPAATVEISIAFLRPPTSPGNAIAFAQFQALQPGEP